MAGMLCQTLGCKFPGHNVNAPQSHVIHIEAWPCTGIKTTKKPQKKPTRVVWLQSKTHSVLATLNRTQGELSSTLKKVFKVDDHLGIAMSGVTADGRILVRYMRTECINHRYESLRTLPAS